MALLALVLDLAFLISAFGIRTAVQLRRTGDSGWRLGGAHRPAERVARLSMLAAGAALGGAVVAAFPAPPPVGGWRLLGAGVAVAAIVVVLLAQLHMGESWRIGVDPDERTEIVTSGLYRFVRNPIYSGMVAFTVGQALILPGALTAAAVVAMIAGVEVQVRIVEEQHLVATHREAYGGWAAGVGRFVPLVGRAPASPDTGSTSRARC
jgi:protein-S-isoprenylcysteine O-methyltransferase Ste14